MQQVIKFDSLLRCLVLATVVISTALYYILQHFLIPEYSVFKVITISSFVSAVLVAALVSPCVFRWIWCQMRKWNKSLYPDLNGTWEGTVTPISATPLNVRATIRQSFLVTQIDLHGETMKSITLSATPSVEQGQHHLYYLYRAVPKKPEWPPYNGTTLFRLRVVNTEHGNHLALSGQYYTDRNSIGTIELSHIDSDPNKDISFF